MLDNPCSNIGVHQNNAMSPADVSFVKVSLKYIFQKMQPPSESDLPLEILPHQQTLFSSTTYNCRQQRSKI